MQYSQIQNSKRFAVVEKPKKLGEPGSKLIIYPRFLPAFRKSPSFYQYPSSKAKSNQLKFSQKVRHVL